MARVVVTDDERAAAFASVGGICIHCLSRQAMQAHHNPPRGASQRRVKSEIVPLCLKCHGWAHQSTKVSVPILKEELVRAKRLHKESKMDKDYEQVRHTVYMWLVKANAPIREESLTVADVCALIEDAARWVVEVPPAPFHPLSHTPPRKPRRDK